MATRQNKRIEIDFSGKWIKTSAVCMAASLFFRLVYYFGFMNLADCGFGEILFSMLLPLLLSGAFVVLIHFLQWNAPGTYGLIGAAFCLLMIVWSFSSGSFLRIVLSAAWYAIAAGVFLSCTGGSLQSRGLCIMMFGAPIAVRFVVFDIGRLSITQWALEGSVLCLLAAVMCIPLALRRHTRA